MRSGPLALSSGVGGPVVQETFAAAIFCMVVTNPSKEHSSWHEDTSMAQRVDRICRRVQVHRLDAMNLGSQGAFMHAASNGDLVLR
jgi:hypothetical protein